MPVTNRVHETGDAVVYAMAEDAVRDLRQLRARGLIVGNRVASPAEWPRTPSGKLAASGGFRKASEVVQLLHFFTDHLPRLLSLAGSIIDPDAALSRLGFGGGK